MISIKLPTGTFEYDPEKPLGRPGGFGQVFSGKSPSGEEIAVKKFHQDAAGLAHRELKIAEELRGRAFEHVVPFIDAGEDAQTGGYFVVMPKADGNLQDRIDTGGPLAPTEIASILLQVAKGLIEVDILVHRDLKPGNILYHEGKWKIADFGISRFYEEATASNTLKLCRSDLYAAPEQWMGERATHASDVYALGCIAFFMLTGAPPFVEDPQNEHLHARVPEFSCPEPRLIMLVNMCLLKVSTARPSLTRVRDFMTDIITTPQVSGDLGATAILAVAAAHVSTKEQQAQANAAAKAAEEMARRQLADGAFSILADNVERLWGKIHAQAPVAKRGNIRGGGELLCQLGNGKLVVNLSRSNVLDPGSFSLSEWDVVAFSQIMLMQLQPLQRWSASLWYAKLKGGADYRWYEVSYFELYGHDIWPHYLPPGRDADMAGSKILCNENFAFGPDAIDHEREDEFHKRWIWLLSKAATSGLQHPKSTPYKWPPF